MALPLNPPVKPMLAKAVSGIDQLPEGDLWFEPKWDGFRCIVFKDGDEIELGSRNERPLTRYRTAKCRITSRSTSTPRPGPSGIVSQPSWGGSGSSMGVVSDGGRCARPSRTGEVGRPEATTAEVDFALAADESVRALAATTSSNCRPASVAVRTGSWP